MLFYISDSKTTEEIFCGFFIVSIPFDLKSVRNLWRWPPHKSWSSRSDCAPAHPPDGQYFSPCCKRVWQTNGENYGEIPFPFECLLLHWSPSSHATHSTGPPVSRSLSGKYIRSRFPVFSRTALTAYTISPEAGSSCFSPSSESAPVRTGLPPL